MESIRIEVLFFSREPFQLNGNTFASGGMQFDLKVSDVNIGMKEAIELAKVRLSNELGSDISVSCTWRAHPVAPEDICTDDIFYYPASNEDSYEVRVTKLMQFKDLALESGIFAISEQGDELQLNPHSGQFIVWVKVTGKDYEVGIGRWHMHLDTIEEVTQFAWWIFTSLYRVVDEYCDGIHTLSWLEIYDTEGWRRFTPVWFQDPYDPKLWQPERGEWIHTLKQQSVYPIPESESLIGNLDPSGHPPGSYLGGLRLKVSGSMILEEPWSYWD